ncbi:hypothetical protein HYX14_01665 [Candidatus Woesearchaeota archaeon]|nr:hypothetical protein [Candidatus Woesearchaeota archaeon]
MNRKSQFDVARKTIYWMIAGVVITMVVLSFAYTIAIYRNALTRVPPQLRAELISLRFTDNCFAWVDEQDIIHPGIVDVDIFTEENLNKCYRTEKEKGFKEFNFRLQVAGKELTTNNYFNQDDFTLYKEVLVKTEMGITKDVMVIYVQEKI